jgi:hypothetical protein
MRKYIIFFVAQAVFGIVAGEAISKPVSLSKEQVATTCGKNMVRLSSGGQGCSISCYGGQNCAFACDKDGKNCQGCVRDSKTGACSTAIILDPSRLKLNKIPSGGLLENNPTMMPQGPSPTGPAPTAPTRAPAGRIY